MTTDAMTHDEVHAHDGHGHAETVSNTVYGFWLYIMSDCILFASIFATFAVLSHNYAGGPTGKELFDLPYVFGETMFLLCSSVTYGFAVLAMNRMQRQQVLGWLFVTFLLGLGFISMEVNEFHHMILEGRGPDRSGFLSAFFTLVGTHGTHVSLGLIWMLIMMIQVMRKGLTTQVQSRLVRLSMFWHFLDIVWIGVFTVVYLIGVM
ncbi:MAG: cytochrome o ubiquinol oxidase subunit III [Acidihalobacter sp.]|uniref:cytochrome o ubiquinol oxidase subunit III n=1 Tax=Acidihalobacter sp. TaxID=1872108 RepID=UPI00307D3689